jgi:hypothetical protein
VQIHGVSEAVGRIEVEKFTSGWAALRLPGVLLVIQSHEDVDRLMIAAARARELLPPGRRIIHHLRGDLSIACGTADAPLCSSVTSEVTCTDCQAAEFGGGEGHELHERLANPAQAGAL